jgi:hypothetical protein
MGRVPLHSPVLFEVPDDARAARGARCTEYRLCEAGCADAHCCSVRQAERNAGAVCAREGRGRDGANDRRNSRRYESAGANGAPSSRPSAARPSAERPWNVSPSAYLPTPHALARARAGYRVLHPAEERRAWRGTVARVRGCPRAGFCWAGMVLELAEAARRDDERGTIGRRTADHFVAAHARRTLDDVGML